MAVGVKETKATIDLDLLDVNMLGHVIAAPGLSGNMIYCRYVITLQL